MQTTEGDWAGRLALVTGAGDGIGAALARGFASWGMTVAVADIRPDAAEAVARELGGDSFALPFDVSDRDACLAAADRLGDRPLALLWANAGVGAGSGLLEGRPRVIEWVFSVNLFGVLWTAQAFAPRLAGEGPRHFGVTASAAAMTAPDGAFPLYATSKHTTFAVGEALRSEFAAREVPSTLLCPGLLNTDIWDAARARPERFGGERRADPETAAYWRAAQDPSVLWEPVARTVLDGGGYLICETDGGELRTRFRARAQVIGDGFLTLS
jgi:NAD(P)-dependent dehydrogenase (short-subunit alcohol dehydrogenase family)